MKKLIPAICMLLVAASLLGTSTFAWFSMNESVTATGMQVKAIADSSLVINNTGANGSSFGTEVTTAFSGDGYTLRPATRYTSADADGVTSDVNLVHLKDNSKADFDTGKKLTNWAYSAVMAESGADVYYHDYVVWIASVNNEIENANMNVELTWTSGTLADTQKAVTVDFYVQSKEDETATFAGKINFAGLTDSVKTTAPLTLSTSRTVYESKDTSTTQEYKVTMRVYFDGDLGYKSYTKVVNNATIAENGVEYFDDADLTIPTEGVEAGVTNVTGKYVNDGSGNGVVAAFNAALATAAGTYYQNTTDADGAAKAIGANVTNMYTAKDLNYVRSSTAELNNIGFSARFFVTH